jgi:hypothetical protein
VKLRHRVCSAVLLTSALLATGPAFGQGSEKDADAERLFTEAKKLMEDKKFAEACPKLESAYRKDQQNGTLLNLAFCHGEMGAKWLAWTEFREAESKSTDAKRKDFARDKMKELEKGLTKLVVDPQTKYELTEVILEDRRIFDAEKSTPFFAEPNNQRKVIFHAKGKKPAIQLISVGGPKEKIQHITVPEMADEEPTPALPVEPTPPATATPATPPPATKSTWSGQKTLGLIVGALGLGGIAVGGVFGLKTMSGSCADDTVDGSCTPDERNAASTDGSISTIAFIAGGSLLVGGVVLFLTAPSGSKTGALKPASITANVGPTWAGLSGTF